MDYRIEYKLYNFETLCYWLKNKLANIIQNICPDEIDLSGSITELSLDSMSIVMLAGELEELLKIEVDPSLLYESDSLESFIQELVFIHQKEIDKKSKLFQNKIVIKITATFTSEPLEECFKYWMEKLGFAATIEFAPYNQVFQQLLTLNYNPSVNNEINIILFRIEDLFHYEKGRLDIKWVRKTVNDFLSALKTASECLTGSPLILGCCPHSPTDIIKRGLGACLDELDGQIYEYAEQLTNVHILDLKNLEKDYQIVKIFDEARNRMGHIPFTQDYFTALGTTLARKVFSLLQPAYKAIILDCDYTLWSGVVGEDGLLGLKVLPAFQFLQNFMLSQMEQGKLLCICSKNNEDDVWEVFTQNPQMILKKEQIISHRINWHRKSQNIKEIAEELNLGLESFILIDDNPTECAEVQIALPQVLTITLPPAPEIPNYLKHHWVFDRSKLTHEDKHRNQMYLENKQRQDFLNQFGTFEDFISQLNINIEIEKISGLNQEELSRAAQLTQRTNQFNATNIRRTEHEIQNLVNSESTEAIAVKVSDRFGDYGFVGLMIVQKENDTLICETFLMSCRVLGRKVEHEMIRYLAELATKYNLGKVQLLYSLSQRNKPIKSFYESLSELIVVDENMFQLVFTPERVENLLSNAQLNNLQAEKLSDKSNNDDITSKAKLSVLMSYEKSLILNEIASYQGDVSKILKSIRAEKKVNRPKLSTEFVTCRTAWHKNIANIWSDVLGIEPIGIYDNFYELGGDSLKAAEVFARMWDLGVPDSISLQTIPNPTVAGLSQAIEDVKNGKTPTLLVDKFSLEDESKLPDNIVNESYNPKIQAKLPISKVFITGATGYIGAFLLSELMIQSKVSVICLVRASTTTEGINRIINNLNKYGLWKEKYNKRIEVILGDLTEPLFGLNSEEFTALSQEIDTIFHSGAWVNFVFPYQHLRAANVMSVETILRLAVHSKPKPIQVHFISTLGVIMSPGYEKGVPVYENNELKHCEGLLNGYEQSKYVGDKMVWKAIKERGIPANIYRPGMVSGLSDSGIYHKTNEFLPSFLKGCIQLGSWPLVDTTFEMVPIDYISKAIIHIALNSANLGQAYFTLHPNSYQVKDFIKWHQDFGYPIRALPWEVWKRELLNQSTERLRENALFPFVDFIRALSEEQVCFPTTDKTNFLTGIKDLRLECVDQLVLLKRYTQYFINIGFYDPPSK